jgi:hypothetical protein
MAASNLTKKVGDAWCRIMHDSPMWPIHGQYQCRRCMRRFPVPWEAGISAASPQAKPRPGFWSALVALILVAALAIPSRAAQPAPAQSDAMMALDRYERTGQQNDSWAVETVQIEAAIPRLSKQGKMRLIRRLIPMSRPQYQIVEISGDQMVKQQVMARYLALDQQAAQASTASLAMTPANYKFHFKQAVETPEGRAYVFRITPRKKRAGLIKGELWLASESGIPVRLSGSFVKNPSIFIKRIEITRDLSIHDGAIDARSTHLLIKTRIAGVAELFIVERPYADVADAETAADHR